MLAREVDPHRRVAPAVYGARQVHPHRTGHIHPGLSTVVPPSPAWVVGAVPPTAVEGTLHGVSRILICAVFLALSMALLSGGPAAELPRGGPVVARAALQDQSSPQLDGAGIRRNSESSGGESSGGEPSRGEFGWPLPGSPTVVSAFEAPAHRYGPGHRGVDLAGRPGTPILAAGAGTVVFAGPVAGRGVISIDHPNGLRTTYEPISPSVVPGEVVAKGQQIGTLLAGHPGCPAVSCLHWGLRRGMDYLDPLRLLGLARLRLLPWEGSSGTAGPHSVGGV